MTGTIRTSPKKRTARNGAHHADALSVVGSKAVRSPRCGYGTYLSMPIQATHTTNPISTDGTSRRIDKSTRMSDSGARNTSNVAVTAIAFTMYAAGYSDSGT